MSSNHHGRRFVRRMERVIAPVWARCIQAAAIPADLARIPVSRCLVLAPHPDDETLGCGATIVQLLRRKARVRVVVATDGRYGGGAWQPEELARLRAAELRQAASVLGLTASDLVRWEFEDGTLTERQKELADAVTYELTTFGPELVLVTASVEPHPDHAALGSAARRAGQLRDTAIWEYMVWGWAWPIELAGRAAKVRRERTGYRRPVSVHATGALDTKRRAIACYPSQLAASAGTLGLPAGDSTGPLEAHVLRHLLQPTEIFFPYRETGERSTTTRRTSGPRSVPELRAPRR